MSWNVNLKQIWKLPHQTHRYFFEKLTSSPHPKVLLARRFLKFIDLIENGDKVCCKFLLRTVMMNRNSVTGKNVRNIELEAGQQIQLSILKQDLSNICLKIHFCEVPDEEKWRIALLKEISLIKSNHLHLEQFNSSEIDEILNYICIS